MIQKQYGPSRSSTGKLDANFSREAWAGSKCSASEVMFRMVQDALLKMPQIQIQDSTFLGPKRN